MLLRCVSCLVLLLSGFSLLAGQVDDVKPKKDAGAVPEGLKALQHPDYRVRYRAAQTLADVGPLAKFAVPELRELLKDKSMLVRVKAAEALWKIDKTPSSVLMPVLLQALKDQDKFVRAAAPPVIALLGSKAKSALPALTQALRDKEIDVKLAVVVALGDLGAVAKGTADSMLELAKDKDFFLLEPFLGAALANLGDGAGPSLAKALAGSSANERRVAAYALGSMGPAAAFAAPALADALKHQDAATRQEAARALGKIGKDAKKALPPLEALLADPDPFVRMEAVLATWHIFGAPKHVVVIVKALSDKSANVRDVACQTLGSMKGDAREAVDPVTKLLQDPELRIRAILTLGEIGPPAQQGLPELRKLLKDKDGETQLSAAFACWQITRDTRESLPVIEKGLESPVHDKLAIRLLGAMGDAARSVLPKLVEMYREEDVGSHRRLLASAIKQIDPQVAMKLGIR